MNVQRGAWWNVLAAVLLLAAVPARAGGPAADPPSSAAFDEILETNVRDGYVPYRTLHAAHAPLDRYVASLANASIASASRDEQIAFWLNTYNAIVLATVTNHYPIATITQQYPAGSIRQVPGAFDRMSHQVAGRSLTLDQIEQTVLTSFHDPRVFFALGRGTVGGGRLRSEAYAADRLETQLAETARECADLAQCLQIQRADNRVQVSSIFSWRETEFVARYASQAGNTFAKRSPVERAIIAFISPTLLAAERALLEENAFRVEYLPFDWSLNDLATRRQ